MSEIAKYQSLIRYGCTSLDEGFNDFRMQGHETAAGGKDGNSPVSYAGEPSSNLGPATTQEIPVDSADSQILQLIRKLTISLVNCASLSAAQKRVCGPTDKTLVSKTSNPSSNLGGLAT
jgi:hypothetical protein